MQIKRIIPCLDVKDGRVVKGVHFEQLRDAGDPAELAELYVREGADELVFLDISATVEGRATMIDTARSIAASITIPFTIAGGIASTDDMKRVFDAGASKIGMNTAAVKQPQLIADGSREFGSERIIVAIDAKYNPEWRDWEVVTHGGRTPAGIRVLEWAAQTEALGAGEILLTSMDRDGTKDGFDVELTAAVADRIGIPVIASGGAGTAEHFVEVLTKGKADAGLAASIFHYRELSIGKLKQTLRDRGVNVR